MAHTKAGGAVKGNRDSVAKRLGIKKFGGEVVINGNIIVRQKGTKFRPGPGVLMGKDYTLYAVKSGAIHYKKHNGKRVVEVV